MQKYFNDIDTPDISYQYFQRRNKLHEQIKENNENETMKNFLLFWKKTNYYFRENKNLLTSNLL